ncbi:MAG: GNAT family N-acetyltransferase [Phycisphaerales bacterium]|nr:GNAT family N-acetyltransferase [Phycisphaerales bacterium]
MQKTVEIHTKRVLLRNWKPSDKLPFATLNADPRVTAFLRGPLSRAESDEKVDRMSRHIREHGFGFLAMEIPGRTPFAGFVGLARADFEAPFTPCIEIGWRLLPDHWGHGYATEAARACLDFAFGPLGETEVVSFTSETNLRSRKVMEKLGMTHDPGENFLHPNLPPEHPLRPHVLHRIKASDHSS